MFNLCLQKLKLKGDFPAKKNTLNKLKMVCWAWLISPLGQDGQLTDFRHFRLWDQLTTQQTNWRPAWTGQKTTLN